MGGIILLAFPLVVLSAMNPLLIALAREARATGDAGAGRVFFISTVGSVAGVLLTAFLLIPYLTNFRALLWMSLGLGLAVGGLSALNREIAGSQKRRLLYGCLIILLLSGGMLAGQRAYFKLLAKDISVKTQEFVMRNDLACGSTIGPLLASQLGVKTADVGAPSSVE